MDQVRSNSSTGRQGFTLVETMVASFIVAVTLSSFMALSMASFREMHLARDYYRAIGLSRNRVERLLVMDYDSILVASEESHRIDVFGNSTIDGAFRRETAVTTVTNDLLEIAVTISFPDRPGSLSSTPVTLRTRYARGL
jgi:prepilin-type N-terminal cleavage/methylation domain-containing protein